MIDWLVGIYMSFAQKYERFMKHEQSIAQQVDMDMEAIRKIKRGTRYVDGDFEPEMPDKEENDKTVGGIDSDKDGVRDDVEIWINYELDTPTKRKALKAMAFDENKFITTKDDSFENLRQIEDANSITFSCFSNQFPRDDIYTRPAPKKNSLYYPKSLSSLISNSNKIRASIYQERQTKLSGSPGDQGYEVKDMLGYYDGLDVRYDRIKFNSKALEGFNIRKAK
jgi:hypothetical protein